MLVLTHVLPFAHVPRMYRAVPIVESIFHFPRP
jgi:hypothetical protein